MIIILDNFPPFALQGVRLGGHKNPRIIVGENYCHFGVSYIVALRFESHGWQSLL